MEKYNHFEIDNILKSMTILIDTREQENTKLQRRIEGLQCPCKRQKLDSGDYSAEYIDLDGNTISLADKLIIERKMSIDEICGNFTKGRERFKREFERAKENNAKIHLLIENGSWDKILLGRYRSKLNPSALTASLLAWRRRYGIMLDFCRAENTSEMIYKILYYELKNILEGGGKNSAWMD